ncbi:MAG: hypothetical protein V3W18_03440 [candidate division Zixibacteria bacterium]
MMVEQGAERWLNLSSIARVAVFAAFAFGVNAPFWAIPNVETFSLALFLTGLFLGISSGVGAAFIAGTIFIFFNPNGPQPVILVGIAQIFGFMLFAFSGGALRKIVLKESKPARLAVILAFSGLILTFWYDLSTNLVFALMFGPFWPTLIGGLTFGIIHLVSNTILFGLSGLIVKRIWKRLEYYLPPVGS